MEAVSTAQPSFIHRIRSAKSVLLILDFDGTLTRIARTPREVVFEKRTQDVLLRMSRGQFYRLAVVSGRSLKDLMSFFHIKNVIYSGNHGLELSGRNLSLPKKAKEAKKLKALVWLLGEKLKEAFLGMPGVLIEDKGYTLSLHYRNVPEKHRLFFNQEVERLKKHYAHWPLVWKKGKKVWEVRPGMKWGKGDMASYLSKKFPGSLPIVIGDDVTDEDMFKALRRRGITIRVGRLPGSHAAYYVKSPRAVARLLKALADCYPAKKT